MAKASVGNPLGALYVRSVVRDVEGPSHSVSGPVLGGGSVLEGLIIQKDRAGIWAPSLFIHAFLSRPQGVCKHLHSSSGVCWQLWVCLLGMVHSRWLAGLSLFYPEDPGPPTPSSSESRVEEPFSVDRAAGIVSRYPPETSW